ncbi:hypothetical protein B0H16DRAFT_1478303 [Mycena metata]|uniref:Uncharacterized protein n=1 Tax=Mycena metata TaxID=1033252 RepID=A0AAD7MEI8_9AGAR|nr:hypothetical protein B0H16DRAFT_1478303 [Mycena metata]
MLRRCWRQEILLTWLAAAAFLMKSLASSPERLLKELKDTLETSRSASTSRHRARISGAASRATPGTHARRTRSSSGAVPAARSSHSSARLRRNAFGRQRAALDRGTVPTLPVGAGTRHSPHHLGTASSKQQGRQGSARPRMSWTAVSRMRFSSFLARVFPVMQPVLLKEGNPVQTRAKLHYRRSCTSTAIPRNRLIDEVVAHAMCKNVLRGKRPTKPVTNVDWAPCQITSTKCTISSVHWQYATLSPGRWKRRTTIIMLLNCVAVYPFPLRARHSVSYIPLFTPLDAQGRCCARGRGDRAQDIIYVSKQQKSGALAQGGIGDTGLAPAVDLG